MTDRIESPTAVVDTNLLVSGLISARGRPAQLLFAFRQGRFRLVVSDYVLDEYQRVLARPQLSKRFGLDLDDVKDLLRVIAQKAIMAGPLSPPPVPVRDPKDELVLATALVGNADYLVSGDQDLLVLAGSPDLGRLQIVTVAAFLGVVDG